MTDDKIIKALNEADGLNEVSLYCADSKGENPSAIKMSDIVDLINRQKAEYEDLQEQFRHLDIECERLEKANESQRAEIERLKKDLDIINAANAELYGAFEENERLKSEIERLEKHTELYHELKSEARKEFAEKLKKMDEYDNHIFDKCASLLVSKEYKQGREEKIKEILNTIDKLVEEMEKDK